MGYLYGRALRTAKTTKEPIRCRGQPLVKRREENLLIRSGNCFCKPFRSMKRNNGLSRSTDTPYARWSIKSPIDKPALVRVKKQLPLLKCSIF